MRATFRTLLLLLALTAAPRSWADQNDPRLGPLFDRLKSAPDTAAARAIELEIWQIWGVTADDQNRVLFERGVVAMNGGDFRTARAAYDLLVARAPNFAEAWNKRATLFYLIGEDAASVADVQRTLALEPRHFGALSGLGLIYTRQEQPQKALRSFEAALAIHPFLPGARASVEQLRQQIEGDPA